MAKLSITLLGASCVIVSALAASPRPPSAAQWSALKIHSEGIWYFAGAAPVCGFNAKFAVVGLLTYQHRFSLSAEQENELNKLAALSQSAGIRDAKFSATAEACAGAKSALESTLKLLLFAPETANPAYVK